MALNFRGRLVERTWLRRPELTPLETKEHKVHKGLFFQLGKDPDTGEVDVRKVDYPSHWSIQRVRDAIVNRERILKTEGCPHCRVQNKSAVLDKVKSGGNTIKTKRLLPGRRPFRDWLSKRSATAEQI